MKKKHENISFRRLRFKLEAAGFDEVRQLGNHAKFIKRSAEGVFTAVIPHYTEISASTLASILKQSGLSKEEFERL